MLDRNTRKTEYYIYINKEENKKALTIYAQWQIKKMRIECITVRKELLINENQKYYEFLNVLHENCCMYSY